MQPAAREQGRVWLLAGPIIGVCMFLASLPPRSNQAPSQSAFIFTGYHIILHACP